MNFIIAKGVYKGDWKSDIQNLPYTVKNTVIGDGMSIEFIGTHRKRKTS